MLMHPQYFVANSNLMYEYDSGNVFSFSAAYVGLATVVGFIWWFVYSDDGPKLNYSELVSVLLVFKFCWQETNCL